MVNIDKVVANSSAEKTGQLSNALAINTVYPSGENIQLTPEMQRDVAKYKSMENDSLWETGISLFGMVLPSFIVSPLYDSLETAGTVLFAAGLGVFTDSVRKNIKASRWLNKYSKASNFKVN